MIFKYITVIWQSGLNVIYQYMKIAIEEAKVSLCEGNNGFGAVIIKDEKIISAIQKPPKSGFLY
jgi:hypothetical protein